ncbi:MAG: phage head closure protein [Oliverpabstia sp.]
MAKVKTYNDGVATICRPKEKERDFRAKVNPTSIKDLEIKGTLMFSVLSARIEDMEYAERIGKKLTLKIKAPNHPGLKKQDNLLIEDVLYDIYHMDMSKDKTELYLYCEEVRKLA